MSGDGNGMEHLIETMAQTQGILITDEMKPHIVANFEIAARMAKAFLEFPLDDREEPAPVFTP